MPQTSWNSPGMGRHANTFPKLIPIRWYRIAFVTDALSTSFQNIHTIYNIFTIYLQADSLFITPQRRILPRILGCPICMAGLPNTSQTETKHQRSANRQGKSVVCCKHIYLWFNKALFFRRDCSAPGWAHGKHGRWKKSK